MSFKQFITKVTDGVQKFYGTDVDVTVRDVRKNNGVILKGMTIFSKESNLSPTIYLDPFYEEYERGESLSDVMKQIIHIYEESKVKQIINMDFFDDYEKVKKQLFCKLINYEKNEEILKEIPHRRYFDLAIVCYYAYANDFIGNGTIMIYNVHLKDWKVDSEQLIETALENTEKMLGYQSTNMLDMLREMISESLRNGKFGSIVIEEELSEEMVEQITEGFVEKVISETNRGPMYIMTNRSKFLGAICMLYHNALMEIADEVNENLVVLPSSVHEVIVVPATEGNDKETLRRMVREINASQVEAQEVLSDNIYYFDRCQQKMTLL